MSLAEEILGLVDRQPVEVEVPEWGGRKLLVASMTATDRDAYEIEVLNARQAGRAGHNVRARLVARCVVDAAGKRVFSDEQIERLGQKSAAALDRLFWAAARLNALSDKDVGELEKK